ncbi:hypothetical protein HMPREF0388_0559 [Mobiluncus curtisii ATCC 51333]|uniref:Uncharacterized protein n=1 Tax=Mobiluncus curtisii ATCC 51333 TaxID=887326 RepID=E6LXH2_9ACTO|nr:hypothetical protein HMPREF0388_0559 [Mobiluncus curtisii ATCC 51333]
MEGLDWCCGADPAKSLGGKDWVYSHHQASPYAVRLEKLYRDAI